MIWSRIKERMAKNQSRKRWELFFMIVDTMEMDFTKKATPYQERGNWWLKLIWDLRYRQEFMRKVAGDD